jgi:hypothetical protein
MYLFFVKHLPKDGHMSGRNMYEVLLTNSMEQRPSWEANIFSASQEIPHISWKPEVHYRILNSPPPVPILSQLDPLHAAIPRLEDPF